MLQERIKQLLDEVEKISAENGEQIEALRIKYLSKKGEQSEENIQATGMLILLILTILVTISDVGKLF